MIKDLVQWKYDRETSQYLAFCLLIVAFIFLTPNRWFEKREQLATKTARVIVQASDLPAGRQDIERTVRTLSGDPNAEVLEVRERTDAAGKLYYDIDIR